MSGEDIKVDKVSKKEAKARDMLIKICEECTLSYCGMCGVYTALKILEQRR